MTVPFRVFWVFALLSNLAAAAQTVGVTWLLADTRLPPSVLIAYQLSGVVGTLAGVFVGSRLIVQLGHRRTLIVSASLEAMFCLVVAVMAYSPAGNLSTSQAFAVAWTCMGAPFAAGIGGPAWMALVARWSGKGDETQQLLLDSVQFQLGRFVGPLVGGATLVATVHAVQWLSIANAVTYVSIAVLMALVASGPEDRAAPPAPRLWRHALRELLTSRATWGIAAVAVASDSARIFLPRLLRESGEGELTYSLCVAALAFAAALMAVIMAKWPVPDRMMSVCGLAGLMTALALWSASPTIGAWAWLLGACVMGASVSVASASLISLLMRKAGPGRRASGAATAMATRTVFGAAGGIALGILIPVLGVLACLVLAAVAGAASVALIRGDDETRNTSETQPARTID